MKEKRYRGYRPYDYLEPGRDYRPFRLAPDGPRVEAYPIPLDPEQEARLDRLMRESLVVSLHDHPIRLPEDPSEVHALRREIARTERDIASLRARAAALSETIHRLRHDPDYLERLAREEHGLVREGETVLKFPARPR
ncbi:MAG: septum formation initiator family protein [Firmicutes bacterium]|nr:septum formation initiator family protein [Bacillota bacterium]